MDGASFDRLAGSMTGCLDLERNWGAAGLAGFAQQAVVKIRRHSCRFYG